MTRRQLIIVPTLTILSRQAEASVLLFLGRALVYLFKRVLDVAISYLVTAAFDHVFGKGRQMARGYAQPVSVAYSSPDYANAYCPWDTIEFAQKGQRFWNGVMFLPNEANRSYSRYQNTDQALRSLVVDSEKRYLLDSSKNRTALLKASTLDEVVRKVSSFQDAKAKLVWEAEQGSVDEGKVAPYLVSESAIEEIDYWATFASNHKTFDPRYLEASTELRRLATWYNFRLLAARQSLREVKSSRLVVG